MSELALTPEPSASQILAAVVSGGVTKENVSVVAEIIKMQREIRAEEAARDFATALAGLQGEMPAVVAEKPVMNAEDKGGGVRYVFAPFEDIMKQLRPFLLKYGFTVRFTQKLTETTMVAVCKLTHTSGHSEENEFAIRRGKGPPGSSEAQADGSNSTYAKRYALCNALNIVITKDDDAGARGASITAEQAADLRRRVVTTKANQDKFLEAAGAETFETIPETKLAELQGILDRREAKLATKPEAQDIEWKGDK